MSFIDGTAVNVALPAIQTSLHATVAQIQWIIEGYTLFLAALLLTGGSLGDLFGQRRIFIAGVIAFTAASVWCGLAPNIQQLILARGAQGIGGALLVPTSLALVSTSFSGKDFGPAIGTWSGFTSIAAALGPVLGGVLSQHASWRWVFFINVPVAAAVLLVMAAFVPTRTATHPHVQIDWKGALLTTLGFGGVVYGFLESSLIPAILGCMALAAFVVVERYERAPMLPLSLFRSNDFTGANVLTLFLYGALGGMFFLLPLNLVQVQGYSETAAGAAMLPFIVLMATLSRWSAGLLNRFSPKILLTVGPAISAMGFAMFAIPSVGGSFWTTFLPAILVLGFGMALTVAPLTTVVMQSAGEDRAGIASGVNNAVSRVAGLLAVAVFGFVLRIVFAQQLDAMHVTDVDRTKLAAAAVTGPEGQAVKSAFVAGFRVVMLIASGVTLLGAGSALALVGRRRDMSAERF